MSITPQDHNHGPSPPSRHVWGNGVLCCDLPFPLALPPAPEKFCGLPEDLHPHAQDAWDAATRLRACIHLFLHVPLLAHAGMTITDESQWAVSCLFPELVDLQRVLGHLAAVQIGTPPPEPVWVIPEAGGVRHPVTASGGPRHRLAPPQGGPFPLGELLRVESAVPALVRRYWRALVAIGVESPRFAKGVAVWDGVDFILERGRAILSLLGTRPEQWRLAAPDYQFCVSLCGEVTNLISLLEDTPVGALGVRGRDLPRPSVQTPSQAVPVAADAGLPRADRTNRLHPSVTCDGRVHAVEPRVAALIECLHAKLHEFVPFKDLQADGELEGQKISNLLEHLKKQHPAIHRWIESRPGKGTRIRRPSEFRPTDKKAGASC